MHSAIVSPSPSASSHPYWETKTFQYACLHERLRLIAACVARLAPGSLLDLGCSSGTLAAAVEAGSPTTRYFGCDISQAAVDAIGRPEVVQRDLNVDGLPFPGEMFDCVVASGMCEYIDYLPEFLREIRVRLRSEGRLIVSYVNVEQLAWRVRRAVGRRLPINPTWRELVTLARFEALLHAAGFEIERRLPTSGRIEPEGRAAMRHGTRLANRVRALAPRWLAPQMIYVCREAD